MKLVVHEDRTTQLQAWLSVDVIPTASALVRTELRRAAHRLDAALLPSVEQVLARLHLLRVDDDVLDLAGRLAPPALRSLDALHVATAVRAGVDLLVTYDRRMTAAAEAMGMLTAAP